MLKDSCNGPIIERAINCDLIVGLAPRTVSSYFPLYIWFLDRCPKSPTHYNFSTKHLSIDNASISRLSQLSRLLVKIEKHCSFIK